MRHTFGRTVLIVFALTLALVQLQGTSFGAVIHFEGFEDPAWTANMTDNWQNNVGTITRVASNTNGIMSSTGVGHATVSASGPYTRFGGYRSSFGGGFTASLDVYLNPNWSQETGFEYSVAASKQDGSHLRDFIFNVGVDTNGDLLVNASNNADFAFNEFKLHNDSGGNNYTVSSEGWYTFEQEFYENGLGNLAVDFRILDSGGTILHTITNTTTDNIATTVGGNRYGWFTYNGIDSLAIDNTQLDVVPEPSSLLTLSGLALCFGLAVRRKRRLQAA